MEAANPHAVGAVALWAAIDAFQGTWIEKAGGEAGVTQSQVRREPVDARGLHGDSGDLPFLEVLDKLVQAFGVGGEGDHLRCDAVMEGTGAYPDSVLVQVKSRAMRVDDFHCPGKLDFL